MLGLSNKAKSVTHMKMTFSPNSLSLTFQNMKFRVLLNRNTPTITITILVTLLPCDWLAIGTSEIFLAFLLTSLIYNKTILCTKCKSRLRTFEILYLHPKVQRLDKIYFIRFSQLILSSFSLNNKK